MVWDDDYEVREIEHHIHSPGRWLGKSADQSGNDWAADTLTVFQAISGSGDYGSDTNDEAKVLGSADTPIITGSAKFDLHKILVVDQSSTTAYKLRIVWGTGTMAAAIAAGQYSEVMVVSNSALGILAGGAPVELQMQRLNAGTKVWVQAKNATNNATIDFFIGLHEYPF